MKKLLLKLVALIFILSSIPINTAQANQTVVDPIIKEEVILTDESTIPRNENNIPIKPSIEENNLEPVLDSEMSLANSTTGVLVDAHVNILSTTKNTDGTITINYKTLKTFDTSAVNVCLGYKWPETYRLPSSQNYCQFIKNVVGTHTMTIPKPSVGIIGSQVVIGQVIGGGGRYTDTKSIKSVFNYPTQRKVTFHTVTKSEALAEYMVVGGMGVGIKFMKKNAIAFITGAAYSGFTTYYGLTGIGVINAFPPRVAGQHFRVESYYSQQGLHIKTEIWNTKQSYESNHTPMYSGIATSKW